MEPQAQFTAPANVPDLDQLLAELIANRDRLSPEEKERLRSLLSMKNRGYRTNKFMQAIRPKLHPKQEMFLRMDDLEVMFGGAAGGGKTDAILLSAMQYMDVPGYSALIIRKTMTDLVGEGAILNRAHKWFAPFVQTGELRWSAHEKSFYVKGGGRIAFAYLENAGDERRYQGWELQFCAMDELTQIPEDQYLFLFSRLRRPEGSKIPLRMRSGTNPGGRYGEWVKHRFIPDEYLKSDPEVQFSRVWEKRDTCDECHGHGVNNERPEETCIYCDGTGEQIRKFVPSRKADNPSLDLRAYSKSLKLLPAVERARQDRGDWSVTEEGGLFKQSWFRYFSRQGDHFILHGPNGERKVVSREQVVIFVTADTASKVKTYSDYTAICTWAMDTVNFNLMLIHCHREKMEIPAILPSVRNAAIAANADFVLIEEASSGIGVIQGMRGAAGGGISVKSYIPGQTDKVGRSTTAQIRMESGQIYLPVGSPGWLDPVIAELVGFPVGEHDDCVDNFSMAAWYVHNNQRMSIGASKPEPLSHGMPTPAGGVAGVSVGGPGGGPGGIGGAIIGGMGLVGIGGGASILPGGPVGGYGGVREALRRFGGE